jgi:hypothetical protein
VRDDHGDGIREVYNATMEGIWTGCRNFLCLFRAVSKWFLAGDVTVKVHYTDRSISTISPNPLEISTCRSLPGGTEVRPQPRVVAGKLGGVFSASATHKI